ncbi:hypothetical protein J6590_043679 [Homalodisca vitripennis]|nr:hypothetical protein J6590_043679 [Homalodisca vitripennis]
MTSFIGKSLDIRSQNMCVRSVCLVQNVNFTKGRKERVYQYSFDIDSRPEGLGRGLGVSMAIRRSVGVSTLSAAAHTQLEKLAAMTVVHRLRILVLLRWSYLKLCVARSCYFLCGSACRKEKLHFTLGPSFQGSGPSGIASTLSHRWCPLTSLQSAPYLVTVVALPPAESTLSRQIVVLPLC